MLVPPPFSSTFPREEGTVKETAGVEAYTASPSNQHENQRGRAGENATTNVIVTAARQGTENTLRLSPPTAGP
jgi:hypothetical protein